MHGSLVCHSEVQMEIPKDPRFIDLTGKQFGRLSVEAYAGTNNRRHYWLCKCECGKTTRVDGAVLRRGDSQSCGCYRSEYVSATQTINLAGHRYGRLVVIKRVPQTNRRSRCVRWLCKCDCGNQVAIDGVFLRSGDSRSCGCLKRELAGKRTRRHGMTGTREYATWRRMLMRCYNPNDTSFALYGGRGIQVDDRWRFDFTTFLADMGRRPSDRHSIGRIDPNGNYCPDNCEWQTMRQQARYYRTTQHITFGGTTLMVREWAERLGTRASVIRARLHRGWSLSDALTLPVGTRRSRTG